MIRYGAMFVQTKDVWHATVAVAAADAASVSV